MAAMLTTHDLTKTLIEQDADAENQGENGPELRAVQGADLGEVAS